MFLSRMPRCPHRLGALALLVAAASGNAQSYTYTLIADTQPGVFNGLMGLPSINAEGRVAFWARLASNNVSGVYTGTGGTPALIAHENGPIGGVFAYGLTSINNYGEVAFYAGLDNGKTGIFKSNGGPLTTIASSGTGTQDFAWFNFQPTINNLGRVAFSGATFFGAVEGAYTGTGGALTKLFDTFGPFVPSNNNGYMCTINDAGMSAFFVKRTNNTAEIARSSGSGVTTMYSNAAPPILAIQSDAGFNNVGRASFTWTEPNLVQYLGHGDGGPRTVVSNSGGSIAGSGNSSISGVNRVASNAIIAPNGASAILTGPSITANKVVKQGDVLFGRTVNLLVMSRRGINDAGQVAFWVEFTDLSRAIIRANPTRPCFNTPTDRVMLLEFDDLNGSIANNAAGGNDGVLGGGAVSDPQGRNGSAVAFDGAGSHVDVPNYPAIDIGEGDFSIEAWVRLSTSVGGRRVIVEKVGDSTGILRGFSFYLQNGRPRCDIMDDSGSSSFNSGTLVPTDGQWHMLAVTLDRDNPDGVRFYLDGLPIGVVGNPTLRRGSLSEPHAALRIGAETAGAPAGFRGSIDDVSVLRRVLTSEEIQSLHAVQIGRCNSSAAVAWDTPMCRFASSAQTKALICNSAAVARTYNYSFSGLSSSVCGTINGPAVFTPFGGSVLVPAGQCVQVPVTIERPSQMTAVGQVGCYEMAVMETASGDLFTVRGSVQDRRDLCIALPDVTTGEVGTPVMIPLRMTNTSDDPMQFETSIVVYDQHMQPACCAVSVHGLPPGDPLRFAVALNPGEEFRMDVPVEFVQYDPFAMYSFVVETSRPGLAPMAAGSTMLRNVIPETCYADCDRSTGVGVLDIFDFLCFGNLFSTGDPYACDCDTTTGLGVCDIFDFLCFGNAFNTGCQ